MLHHHGGAGSPSYMAPTTDGSGTAPFSPTPTGPAVPAVTADIPAAPPTMQLQPAAPSANFEELPAGGSGSGAGAGVVAVESIQDDDMQADFGGAISGAGASGSGGHHRWPREETLALIRIRTEMDADFRNAPLKTPLWEDVARKLAALGYQRSAKKCKEKFENVDKYYKRTKDARAGRQDGKSYRFFSQLEALHAAAPPPPQQLLLPPLPPPSAMSMTTVQAGPHQPMAMAWTAGPTALSPATGAGLPDLSFSSMSGSDSDSDSYSDDYDDSDDAGEQQEGLGSGRGECDREMMAIFEGMMKQVTEKQDAMQRVFLETLERWEAERTAREEAWRRQEVARMNREREQLARERAAAASRDAALIAFLQRIGGGGGQGQPVRLPPHSAGVVPAPPMPDHRVPPSPRHDAASASLQQQLVLPAPPLKAVEAFSWAAGGGEGSGSTSSSRWPKEEVEALIQMRNEKDEQYHDAGGKGPLWEDIAAGMRRIGYNRSAKRCKEKWENINKYYKKVKESNKRRPEDSKTCPYFHQLDAMYRKKHRGGGGRGSRTAPGGANMANAVTVAAVAVAATVQDNKPSQRELEGKSSNDVDSRKNAEQGNLQASPGSRDTAAPTPGDGAKNKTTEDNVNETNVQQQQEFSAYETDSDDDINMAGDYTVYTEEGNDEDKMKYKMGVQKPDVIGSRGNVPAPPSPPPPPPPPSPPAAAAAAATAAAPTSTSAAPTSSTFLAVQ